ncbi:MAG: hypothetical protein IBX55_23345 [Methyloprofundus sp.]|nr:hypothetical protein [Methyloprofundus sp.]
MPFMVSVNKFSLYIGIPLLLVIYLAYVLGSFFFYDDQGRLEAIETHFNNVAERQDINAIILGGSNSLFSLSADMLSEQTPMRFYNASIVNEGFSSQNYFKFIEDLFTSKQAEKVKLVFYSPIHIVRSDEQMNEAKTRKKDILGKEDFPGLLPEKTFARFLIDQLKSLTKQERFYGNVTSQGDFIFKGFNCEYEPGRESEFKAPSTDAVLSRINERQNFVQTKFPNARLVIVFPLEYDADPSIRNHYFNRVSSKLKDESIEFIIQESTQDSSLICDAKHHTNDKGRTFRTNDLINQLLENLETSKAPPQRIRQ